MSEYKLNYTAEEIDAKLNAAPYHTQKQSLINDICFSGTVSEQNTSGLVLLQTIDFNTSPMYVEFDGIVYECQTCATGGTPFTMGNIASIINDDSYWITSMLPANAIDFSIDVPFVISGEWGYEWFDIRLVNPDGNNHTVKLSPTPPDTVDVVGKTLDSELTPFGQHCYKHIVTYYGNGYVDTDSLNNYYVPADTLTTTSGWPAEAFYPNMNSGTFEFGTEIELAADQTINIKNPRTISLSAASVNNRDTWAFTDSEGIITNISQLVNWVNQQAGIYMSSQVTGYDKYTFYLDANCEMISQSNEYSDGSIVIRAYVVRPDASSQAPFATTTEEIVYAPERNLNENKVTLEDGSQEQYVYMGKAKDDWKSKFDQHLWAKENIIAGPVSITTTRRDNVILCSAMATTTTIQTLSFATELDSTTGALLNPITVTLNANANGGVPYVYQVVSSSNPATIPTGADSQRLITVLNSTSNTIGGCYVQLNNGPIYLGVGGGPFQGVSNGITATGIMSIEIQNNTSTGSEVHSVTITRSQTISTEYVYEPSSTIHQHDDAYTYIGSPMAMFPFMPRMLTGSYQGTGTYGTGSSNINSITFDTLPTFIYIGAGNRNQSNGYGGIIHIATNTSNHPVTGELTTTTSAYGSVFTSSGNKPLICSLNGNTLSWYTNNGSADYQLNASNTFYAWTAFCN